MSARRDSSRKEARLVGIGSAIALVAIWAVEPGSQVAIVCAYLAVFLNLAIYLNMHGAPEWAETAHGIAAIAPIFIWRFGAPFAVAMAVGLAVQVAVLVGNHKILRSHLAILRRSVPDECG